MNGDTFYPYSFNGGGDYDGYVGGVEEPRAFSPRKDSGAVATDGEDDTLMKDFSLVMEEYLNTGTVADPENARIFSGVFPELKLPDRAAFLNIGSGSAGSVMTGRTMGGQIDGAARTVNAVIRSLRTKIRIPEKSVKPANNMMGDVMKNFLDEVERNIFSSREARDGKGRHKRCRKDEEEPREDEDEEDDDDSARSGRSGLEDEKKVLLNIEATRRLHAPWFGQPKFNLIESEADADAWVVDHDLTISQKIFSKYVRALREERIASVMREDERVDLVTLVLESESDVWMACGGEKNAMSPDTWITKRSARLCSREDGDDESEFPDLRENFRDFLRNKSADGPGFVTEEQPLESQVYSFFKSSGSTDAVTLTKNMVEEFYKWMKNNKKRSTDVPLTSILREGGDESTNVQEHADRLVTLAILNGYVEGSARNVRDQLLFKNSLPKKKLCKKKTDTPGVPISRVDDGLTDNKIVEYFRKGKEKFISRLTDGIGCDRGGPNAKLVVDLEYRTHFIKLCRANHLLKTFEQDSRVVTDRRKRILDQERVKRECLHFFQTKCGMGSRINADYLR